MKGNGSKRVMLKKNADQIIPIARSRIIDSQAAVASVKLDIAPGNFFADATDIGRTAEDCQNLIGGFSCQQPGKFFLAISRN